MPLAPATPPPRRALRARAPSPPGGWKNDRAPGRRLHGLDLTALDEDPLARAAGGAAIVALGADPGDYDPAREPLVLVHGLLGAPRDFQRVVDRLAPSGFQLHAACYDDVDQRTSANGDALAKALKTLFAHLVTPRPLTLVAHSMGGLVARRALNRLALDPGRPLERFAGVHLLAIDSPWQGYEGPGDRGLDAIKMAFARPFLPDGVEDMRAASEMFQGDPDAGDPAARAGLYRVTLPASVRVEIVFAEKGILTRPEAAPALAALPSMLVAAVRDDRPPRGDVRAVNLWLAVVASTAFPALQTAAERLALAGKLDATSARRLLDAALPRYPGDHGGVLRDQPAPSLLDALAARAGV
ncbi:MAG: hypothetical protein U0324_44780 [Polyangiales bacterium]